MDDQLTVLQSVKHDHRIVDGAAAQGYESDKEPLHDVRDAAELGDLFLLLPEQRGVLLARL